MGRSVVGMSPSSAAQREHHVLIAGGGVAALETLLALRVLAGSRPSITMLAPDGGFTSRPASVGEPFDLAPPRTFSLADIAEDQNATLVEGSLAGVDVQGHEVRTATGERLFYDTLVVATGATPTPTLEDALTFTGHPDAGAMGDLLDDLVTGRARSAAFVLPRPGIWPLPLYELALMTGAHVRARGATDRILTLVTPEARPLDCFGPAAAEALEPLLQARGVTVLTESRARSVAPGRLLLAGGSSVPADRVVALPAPDGVDIPGLPGDAAGFLGVDVHGQVTGCADVYAAGDITSFPFKQGGLAAQQADCVAEAIAACLGVAITPSPFRPVLRGLLLTGGVPLYLRAEPGPTAGDGGVAREAALLTNHRVRASGASTQALWWPPAKIAARYLGPYMSTARPQPLGRSPLFDRAAPEAPPSEADHQEALELTLALAEADARWGDREAALRSLDAAEALGGGLLPAGWAERRDEWNGAFAAGR